MWNVISTIFNVIFFGWIIYYYLENRKLKGFEIDKNIKLKKREIEELEQLYPKEKKELAWELERRGRTTTGFKEEGEEELKQKYENKKTKLNIELSHLKKQKKYKWLFSKDC